jgi:glycolate oxidase
MSSIAMPPPDAALIARRAEIVEALEEALAPGAVISDPAETLAYECDALTAYRCPPLAVVLPRSTEEVSPPRCASATPRRAGHAARLGHLARGRRAADRRLRDPRRGAPERSA